jgi:zinc transporter ZupT
VSDVLRVAVYASITAVATGLGAVPFFFVKAFPRKVLGWAGGLAAGIMGAASFNLIYEGLNYSPQRTIAGIVIGLIFIALSHRILRQKEDLTVGDLAGADAMKALMIMGIMTLHSFAEGVGVGVSFGGGEGFGLFISLSIAVHNIPEGVAISLVLIPRGVKPWKAALLAIVSSLPQPLIAVPSFLFVQFFRPFLPIGLGLAAGAMIWMVIADLVPDAFEDAPKHQVATSVALAVAAMTAFQVYIGN